MEVLLDKMLPDERYEFKLSSHTVVEVIRYTEFMIA